MDPEIQELEQHYEAIIHPLNFFKDFTPEKFKEWLKIDEYGNEMNYPREEDVIAVYNAIESYEELGYLQDICLQQLIELKNLNLINIKN